VHLAALGMEQQCPTVSAKVVNRTIWAGRERIKGPIKVAGNDPPSHLHILRPFRPPRALSRALEQSVSIAQLTDRSNPKLASEACHPGLVLRSRSHCFAFMFHGCAFKVLACRAFELALAVLPLVGNHACHAHVPATPWTWTPGDWLVSWDSGLRLVHQTPGCFELNQFTPARAQSCSILLTSRRTAALGCDGQSAAIGACGKSICFDHFTAGRHGTAGQQGQRTAT
jgi:hypothetical protein